MQESEHPREPSDVVGVCIPSCQNM